MSIPPALLGIDGGGTSTVAWLADRDGVVRGAGRSGPSNAKAVGADAAREALAQAIERAFADASATPAPVEVACLGLAGFDRPDDREILAAWAEQGRWATRTVLVNDGDLVIAAGTPEGWGIAVIAGTGSIAVGRDREGKSARAGGWGPLIGDEGSAYAVVLAALRLVARHRDGREPRGAAGERLTGCLCAALAVPGPEAIVTALYAPGFDRARIAALAPAVLDATRDDPDLAARLLVPAGAGLAELVIAVARTLGWAEGAIPLAVAGSFLLAADGVYRAMVDRLDAGGTSFVAGRVREPVRGALILAGRALHDAGSV